jgi:hypothetical protein
LPAKIAKHLGREQSFRAWQRPVVDAAKAAGTARPTSAAAHLRGRRRRGAKRATLAIAHHPS